MASPSPTTPKRQHLYRDERLRIQTLRDVGFKYKQIQEALGYSYRQIQGAYLASRPTPKKRSGRPPVLSEKKVDEIELFIRLKRSHRLLSYERLAIGPFKELGVGFKTIKNTLKRRRYRRCITHQKPPLLKKNRRARLAFI